MPTAFFTGFPGFLGRALLPRVLAQSSDTRAVCLVQPKFASLARDALAEMEAGAPELVGRVELAQGDITVRGLGLEDAQPIADRTTEIYHLAAVYDLSVKRDVAMRINVEGTRNVLDFAESCRPLSRVQYVSTCYVSGRYAGIFEERDLDRGQSFNNFYEETKFLAEVDVRSRMVKGLPATIYRPSIVVGDSKTGVTQKYDGPYYVIQWLLRQPRLALMPIVGDPKMVRLNVVPRDFVLDALGYLAAQPTSLGKTFQLADPEPLTIDEMVDAIGDACDRLVLRPRLPVRLAKLSIDRVPGVYGLLRMPSSLIDYMVHPTHYATRDTQAALAPSGIRVPNFRTYVRHLAEFVRTHPEFGSAAMI